MRGFALPAPGGLWDAFFFSMKSRFSFLLQEGKTGHPRMPPTGNSSEEDSIRSKVFEEGGLEGKRNCSSERFLFPLQCSFPFFLHPHQCRETAGDFKVGGIVDVEKGQGFGAGIGDMGTQALGDDHGRQAGSYTDTSASMKPVSSCR